VLVKILYQAPVVLKMRKFC